MNAILDRLRGLRAQSGALNLGAKPARDVLAPPSNVLGLRQLYARHRALPATPRSDDRELPGVEVAPGLRYLEAQCAWIPLPEAIYVGFAPKLGFTDAVHPHRIVAFDTETTGLAGGSGTRAFMIGAADWQGRALRIRQLLITTLAAEGAMLAEFANWLRADSVLVSYNGRSYDAPLLATRYRLARQGNPLAGLAHLDLLHPTRRRYKGVYENCRLATIERQLLGVVRDDDLPGSEAPAAWLNYLRGGSAANLRRVATHNATDLSSLAALLLRLSSQAPEVNACVAVS